MNILYATCPICNRNFQQITNSHLKKHNITPIQFKLLYPDYPLKSENILNKEKQNLILRREQAKKIKNKLKIERRQLLISKYAKNPKYCKQCNKIIPFPDIEQKYFNDKYRYFIRSEFCNMSCATLYNNTHKEYGYRRSKLEQWIEEQLIILYPNLEIHFNRKDAINSELDIYIPSLRLAFELNGIFHYEPIYSQEQFEKIQNNDQRKFKLCIEHNISLCIIDTSNQKQFKESTSKKYLDIITNIINNGLTDGACSHTVQVSQTCATSS